MAFYSHLIAISILRHKDGKKGEKKKRKGCKRILLEIIKVNY